MIRALLLPLAIALSLSTTSGDNRWTSKVKKDHVTIHHYTSADTGTASSSSRIPTHNSAETHYESGDASISELELLAKKRQAAYNKISTHFKHCRSLGDINNIDIGDCDSKEISAPNPAASDDSKPAPIDYFSLVSDAWNSASISGTNMQLQPPGENVLIRLPVIVVANHVSDSRTLNVGGTAVSMSLRAVSFTVNWGDGTIQTYGSAPRPYPHHNAFHRYQRGTYSITLTTKWEASWTHPETGQTITEPNLLETVEHSRQFKAIPSSPVLINRPK